MAARPDRQTPVQDAARSFAAATSAPMALGAWREVSRTGRLRDDPDPDRTAAGMVRRWHQHLAVAIDLPMERELPGEDRLRQLLEAWLDLARRTEPVRRHVARTAGARATAEQARQRVLLSGLLAQDLEALGALEAGRAGFELVLGLERVAAAEDAAGRRLARERRALLASAGLPVPVVPVRRRWWACAGSRHGVPA